MFFKYIFLILFFINTCFAAKTVAEENPTYAEKLFREVVIAKEKTFNYVANSSLNQMNRMTLLRNSI